VLHRLQNAPVLQHQSLTRAVFFAFLRKKRIVCTVVQTDRLNAGNKAFDEMAEKAAKSGDIGAESMKKVGEASEKSTGAVSGMSKAIGGIAAAIAMADDHHPGYGGGQRGNNEKYNWRRDDFVSGVRKLKGEKE
jgi:hypothetical protein